MGALIYRGRRPTADFAIMGKKNVDDLFATTKVDLTYVNNQVATKIAPLATTGYVDRQDAQLAKKTDVDAADTGYLLASTLGVGGGIAKLGSNVRVLPSHLPGTLQTERPVFFKNSTTLYLTGTATQEIGPQNNPREFNLAELIIPDLGYPYVPLFFATITAGAVLGAAVNHVVGTGNYAQFSVQDASFVRYAYCLTGSQKTYETFTVLPNATSALTPLGGGPKTFNLWAGLQSGATYTLSAVGLTFWAMCFPGL